jgi:hypothetical protein
MKITLVGPGLSPIPPTGWGAVEILVWEMNLSYQKMGHDVQIVNTIVSPMFLLINLSLFYCIANVTV